MKLNMNAKMEPTEVWNQNPDNDVVVNPLELRAHRLVLAAAIPYFRDRAKGWKIESVMDGVRFYGSAFRAKLLLGMLPTPHALEYLS